MRVVITETGKPRREMDIPESLPNGAALLGALALTWRMGCGGVTEPWGEEVRVDEATFSEAKAVVVEALKRGVNVDTVGGERIAERMAAWGFGGEAYRATSAQLDKMAALLSASL